MPAIPPPSTTANRRQTVRLNLAPRTSRLAPRSLPTMRVDLPRSRAPESRPAPQPRQETRPAPESRPESRPAPQPTESRPAPQPRQESRPAPQPRPESRSAAAATPGVSPCPAATPRISTRASTPSGIASCSGTSVCAACEQRISTRSATRSGARKRRSTPGLMIGVRTDPESSGTRCASGQRLEPYACSQSTASRSRICGSVDPSLPPAGRGWLPGRAC